MQSFEAIVRQTALACQAPMATIAVIERDRARFKASVGASCAEDVPLTFSLLAETLACEDVLTLDDARADERFASSPVVAGGPCVRAYAGVPLQAADGSIVGVLAVGDSRPRGFTHEQIAALRDFGTITSSLIVSSRELALRRLMSRAIEEALDFVLISDAALPAQGGPFIEYVNASLLHALGYTSDELIGEPLSALFDAANDSATLQSFTQNIEIQKDNEKEMRLRRKDGTTFWAEFTGRPLLDEDDVASHWISVGRDISGNRETLTQTAALLEAVDIVHDQVEIYNLENGAYALAFQNAASDEQATAVTERLLTSRSIRDRLREGETIRLAGGRLTLRPLANGENVICVRRMASALTAAAL